MIPCFLSAYIKGCISDVGWRHFCWCLKRDPKQTASSPLPSAFRASSKNDHERSAKPHHTHPLSVIGWNTIYFGFEWLAVPFVSVYDLGAQAAYRDVFFEGLLKGRAASGPWGEIRLMWYFLCQARVADATFKCRVENISAMYSHLAHTYTQTFTQSYTNSPHSYKQSHSHTIIHSPTHTPLSVGLT